MNSGPIHPDMSAPLPIWFVPGYSHNPAFVIFAQSGILVVDRLRSLTEIFEPVVALVSIDMVDAPGWPLPHCEQPYNSMSQAWGIENAAAPVAMVDAS